MIRFLALHWSQDHEFAHMLFMGLFGVQPLVAILAFLGGGVSELVRRFKPAPS